MTYSFELMSTYHQSSVFEHLPETFSLMFIMLKAIFIDTFTIIVPHLDHLSSGLNSFIISVFI